LCSDHSARFAVLIAAYNASKTIESVLTETRRFWRGAVVVVNDGSTDGTGAAAEALADVVLRHEVNRGKGAALITGLTYLRENGYNAAITLDADGQHPPELIPEFVAKYQETACDLVVGGRPFALGRMPLLRLLGNRLSSFWVSVACGRSIPDSQCGFRLYDLRTIPLEKLTTHGFDAETEMLLETCRRGGRIEQVKVPLIYRASRSHFDQLGDTLAIARVIARYLFSRRRTQRKDEGGRMKDEGRSNG